MGAPSDPLAVCDGAGRVIGIEGLRVCDASLFPTIPSANLNLPVMMTAERIAGAMRDEHRNGHFRGHLRANMLGI